MLKKVFMSFVALLAIAAAATGPARAQSAQPETLLTTVTAASLTTYDETTPGIVTVSLNDIGGYTANFGWLCNDNYTGIVTVQAVQGYTITRCVFRQYPNASPNRVLEDDQAPFTATMDGAEYYVYAATTHGVAYGDDYMDGISTIEVYGYQNAPTYITARMAAGTEDAANWSLASGNAQAQGTQVLENVMSGSELTATYNGTTKKVKSVKAVKYVPPVLVQSIVLDKQTAFLAKDSTMTLSVASVLPENAADKSYTWSSDATDVALVNENGVVTAVAFGTANIIATANDGSGVKDTCVVTVLRTGILDGVTLLYASDYGLETWSTVIGYNPGVLYQDDYYVKLTSNGAILFQDGTPELVDENFHPGNENYQWLLLANISGAYFYYHQGETWEQAINAGRMYSEPWSINDGKVILNGDFMLVDTNHQPVAPTATIDPSTVNYHFDPLP